MSVNSYKIHGVRILEYPGQGFFLRAERDAGTLIGDAFSHSAQFVLLSDEQLSEDFFDLSTRLAGDVIQKFVNYGLRLAIVGDISMRTERSQPLRDFVYETNRGKQIWFVRDRDEFDKRLRQSES
jgi:hypothetical protein